MQRDVSWEVKHYNVSLIDQIVRVSTDLGFAGADAVFPGWRTLRWGTPKAINGHHFFYESQKALRSQTLARQRARADGAPGAPGPLSPPLQPVPAQPASPTTAAATQQVGGRSVEADLTESQWRALQMGVEGELSRRVPPGTMETLLQSDALQSDPALAVEQALQAGSFMLPGQVARLPDTVEREQIAFDEFKQGGMAFDTRNTLAASPPANLTPYPTERVPPTIPATAENTVMPLPLAARGPVDAVMRYSPAIPAPGPLAAPTVVNQTNETEEAKRAAACERQRRSRMARKRQATEAAGLPPVADLTPAEVQKKANRKRTNTKYYHAKLAAAQHGHIDSDG